MNIITIIIVIITYNPVIVSSQIFVADYDKKNYDNNNDYNYNCYHIGIIPQDMITG